MKFLHTMQMDSFQELGTKTVNLSAQYPHGHQLATYHMMKCPHTSLPKNHSLESIKSNLRKILEDINILQCQK